MPADAEPEVREQTVLDREGCLERGAYSCGCRHRQAVCRG
jgi:hypothetical protein